MDLFKLLGTISIDISDATKALDETSDKGQKTESKLKKAFSGVGKGAAVVGKAVGAGLAVGGAAMGALAIKALNLSGELEQNMGGSEAVFGKYASKMQETAKNAFGNMGLSTSDFLGTANKMGALFQGAGFDIKTSADMSSKAMQRAADVASIMGIDTGAAMEAIAGAAKGNFTMMDNLGVAMNDTTLQAYALSKGIDKSTTEMTNQEKIGLAMEMFMEKTAYAAGNYAKENETLAGSLGTAKAALTNFLDGSGDVDQLVTAFSNAANVIIDNLKTLAPRLITGMTDIVNQITPKLPGLLQELLPVIVQGAVSLINGLVSVFPELAQMLITSVLPDLLSGFTTIVNTLIQALPQMATIFANALPSLIPKLITALVSMMTTLASNLPAIVMPILQKLPEIAIAIVTSLVESLSPLAGSVFSFLEEGLQAIFDFCQQNETVLTLLGIAVGTLTAAIIAYNSAAIIKKALDIAETIQLYAMIAAETAHTVATTIATAATTAFGAAMAFLTSPITLVILAIGALIAIIVLCVKNWDKIKEAGAKAWEWIKKAWSKAADWFKDIWEGIKKVFSNIGGWFKDKFNDAKQKVISAWSDVKAKFTEIKNKVLDAFSNIKDKLAEPFTKARDKIKEIADKIKGFFKGEISMPKIKTPKFSIKPSGWKIGDLLDGVIPKLGITWHADGGIMKEPTLFGYNPATGMVHGGGEAGDEAIAPISTLQQYVRAAVASENSIIVTRLDRVIELLVQFFPDILNALDFDMYLDGDTLVARTASRMDSALGKIAVQKGRGR